MQILIPPYFVPVDWFDTFMLKKIHQKTKEKITTDTVTSVLVTPVSDTAVHPVLLPECMHVEISGKQNYYDRSIKVVISNRD